MLRAHRGHVPTVEKTSIVRAIARVLHVDDLDRLTHWRRLLDEARAALSGGRAGAALEAARAHKQRFPRGALVEERESVWIRALARAGRVDEARKRAQRFFSRYPRSIYRAAVERSVGGPGAPP